MNKKRHNINASLWKAFLSFFCLHENLYQEAVKKIISRTSSEALMSDIAALQGDFSKVLHEKKIHS
ncbi:hypothetical protein QTN47_06525 [Danxiaibacter flavus]|uniref:Uncharacterized protein n=1 Tax=Danxiaibacter flavus TaxID=3049108 RepID=A0ABV3ZBA3_9BACT|nr:hypothetical protein QNM32_06525 [Chitinophagaceae bacterium DXS]